MIINNMGWMFVVVPGLIWGASFLFIAEGLQAVAPMGVTFVRIAIGFATLSLVPSARRPILPRGPRQDREPSASSGSPSRSACSRSPNSTCRPRWPAC